MLRNEDGIEEQTDKLGVEAMIKQGFNVGDNEWYIMCYYDISTDNDLSEVGGLLIEAGAGRNLTKSALENLNKKNTGFIFTRKEEHISFIFVSKATSAEQSYDTIQHELKHVVSHICEEYGIAENGEEAAYIQGEIARNMFKAASVLFCPQCNCKDNKQQH